MEFCLAHGPPCVTHESVAIRWNFGAVEFLFLAILIYGICIFTAFIYTKFYIPSSSDFLVIIIKLEATFRIYAIPIFFF
jgi:hypothetical protein